MFGISFPIFLLGEVQKVFNNVFKLALKIKTLFKQYLAMQRYQVTVHPNVNIRPKIQTGPPKST